MHKVLIFGDDTGPCLAIARSLGRRGAEVHLTTHAGGSASSRSSFVAGIHSLPLYARSGSEWLAGVRALCTRNGFGLLVPTSDSSLEQLLRHRADFGDVKVALPNAQAATCFTNKLLTRQLAQASNVPVAEGSPITRVANEWRLDRDLALPVVLKRKHSYECGDPEQKVEPCLARSQPELERALATGRFDLAESFLPGFCRGVSVLARDGRVLAAHQHRRLQQKHATGPSSVRISEACDPQLLEWTRRLVRATHLTGVAMFEFRHDPASGQNVLLEVNPRFWGSLPLAAAAGADFPALLAGMIMEHHDPPLAIGSRPGVIKLNPHFELDALSDSIEQAGGWRDYLTCAKRAARLGFHLVWGRAIDSWASDDPLPFRFERQQLLSRVREALLRRFATQPKTLLEAAE